MTASKNAANEGKKNNSTDAVFKGVSEWSCDAATEHYTGTAMCYRLRNLVLPSKPSPLPAELWWHNVHQADQLHLKEALRELRMGHVDNMSVRYRTQGQPTRWRWVLTRATATQQGKDQRLISGIDIDVTELYDERSEHKPPHELAKQYEIALADAQQGVWTVDLGRGFHSESDSWRTMRGYSADSNYSPSSGWKNDIHPEDRAHVLGHEALEYTENSDNFDYSYRQLNSRGEWVWIWSRGRIIERDNKGEPLVFIGTDTDITRIKTVESRYEQLSNTLEIAIKAAGMGVWEWTMNSTVNVWNRRTREIFGVTTESDAVSHDVFAALIHPEDLGKLTAELNAAVDNRLAIDVEYRINHVYKGVRYIKSKATCNPIVGESPRYVGIVWDITDMIHAEQERSNLAETLNHSQRLQVIGELTGGIAHDFNNLLAVISGNAELLSLTQTGENKFVDAISSAAQRGALLTRGLLAFSRKGPLQPAPVKLEELVNDTCSMLDRTLGATISISCNQARKLWHCEADSAQLENALINLIVNARDAMDKGGSIIIDTANIVLDSNFENLTQAVIPGEFVSVSVTDSGTGMSRSVIDESIVPFFTTKATGDGHGLGLSMVFSFIKQSHGHMTIDSVKDRGTVVTLYLPRCPEKIEPVLVDPVAKPQTRLGNGETILLVEDEQSVQDIIRKSLDFLGYRTICVNSGAEALRQFAENTHDIELVISDIVLSEDMNGFELSAELSRLYPGTRILFISGYAQDALKKRGTRKQDVTILEKPFAVDELASHITQRLHIEA